jgi:hypothetical protein
MNEPVITISVAEYNKLQELRYNYYCELYNSLHEELIHNCENWHRAQPMLNKYKELALIEQSKIVKK